MRTAEPLVEESRGRTLSEVNAEETLHNLKAHGAVILRGFSVGAEDFSHFGRRVVRKPKHTPAHRGTHPLHRSVQTVTPGMQSMGFHAEYSHLPDGVDVMAFWHEVPAGQTMLCDGAVLWRAVSEETRAWLRKNPLKFTSWHEPQAWIAATGTADIAEIQRNSSHIRNYRVLPGPLGGLLTEYVVPAVIDVVGTEALVANVFPGAYAALWVTDEDGLAVPQKVLENIWSAAAETQTIVSPQPGDVVLVHNRRVLHARGRQGPQRRAWAILGNYET